MIDYDALSEAKGNKSLFTLMLQNLKSFATGVVSKRAQADPSRTYEVEGRRERFARIQRLDIG